MAIRLKLTYATFFRTPKTLYYVGCILISHNYYICTYISFFPKTEYRKITACSRANYKSIKGNSAAWHWDGDGKTCPWINWLHYTKWTDCRRLSLQIRGQTHKL